MTEHSNPRKPVIALDGPAGAGKSTVARELARSYALLNLESGAMYRAFALKALRAGLSPDDGAALEALSASTTIQLVPEGDRNRVLLDGNDVTADLRTPEVTQAASRVSVFPQIRAWMVALQQQMGVAGGVVMEGRDIGTVVFPHAEVKIFLEASTEVRARRRTAEMGLREGSEAAARILAEMRERDYRDRNRADSPLRPAPDAILLDSSNLTLEQVVDRAVQIVEARIR